LVAVEVATGGSDRDRPCSALHGAERSAIACPRSRAAMQLALALSRPFRGHRAPARGNQEHHALSHRVRREEGGDLVVEERQAGGAEALRIAGEIGATAADRGIELRGAIAAVAEA